MLTNRNNHYVCHLSMFSAIIVAETRGSSDRGQMIVARDLGVRCILWARIGHDRPKPNILIDVQLN